MKTITEKQAQQCANLLNAFIAVDWDGSAHIYKEEPIACVGIWMHVIKVPYLLLEVKVRSNYTLLDIKIKSKKPWFNQIWRPIND